MEGPVWLLTFVIAVCVFLAQMQLFRVAGLAERLDRLLEELRIQRSPEVVARLEREAREARERDEAEAAAKAAREAARSKKTDAAAVVGVILLIGVIVAVLFFAL